MKDFKSEEERKQYIRDMDELMAIVNSGPKSNKLPHSDLILEEIVKSGKPGVKVGSKPAVSQNPSTHRSQQVPKYKIQKKKVKSRKKILIPPGLKKALLIALAGIGVVAIGATIANCLSKTGWVKGDPIDPPESSVVEISHEESSKEESSILETSQEETSIVEESSREEKRHEGKTFSKDDDAISDCQEYRNNWFGEYIVETAVKYGVDPNYALAQLRHESIGFRHETVLPAVFMNQGHAIPGDDGNNFFNGTGYGIGQITVPEEDQVLKAVDILNGNQDTILINEQNAVNESTNVQIYAMLNQDNQDRILAVLIDYYNEAIGQKDCFSIDKIKRILSGEHLGLPFDEQRAAKEIMNAVFNANIQCYNYGLGDTLDCVEFSSDGYFLEDKFTQNVRYKHDSRDDFGDADYRQHVLAGVSTDKVTTYVYELSGYVTYDVTKPANDMFESYTYSPAPVQVAWNYDNPYGQRVNS